MKSHLSPDGNATYIAHSGSTFAEVGLYNPRIHFNLIVSAGQEIGVTMDEYMDYAIEVNDTKLLCLFCEMARQPEAFIAALDKAESKGVPVIACKVGRSEKAAAFAQTHSGALVGNDAAYQAVFDHYGVTRVTTLDEMINTATLFSSERKPGPGGLSLVIDSGGERELVVDVAEDVGVPFAEINETTVAKLEERLFYALDPVNPLDAWGDGSGDWEEDVTHFLVSLAEDPDTSISTLSAELSFVRRHRKRLREIGCRCLRPNRQAGDRACQHLDGSLRGNGAGSDRQRDSRARWYVEWPEGDSPRLRPP